MTHARDLYLDLMKNCLTDMIYADQQQPSMASDHGAAAYA